MTIPHTKVSVLKLPDCDFCGEEAHYDGKTKLGPWGNMCRGCFRKYGIGLGLGRGQELVVESNNDKD